MCKIQYYQGIEKRSRHVADKDCVESRAYAAEFFDQCKGYGCILSVVVPPPLETAHGSRSAISEAFTQFDFFFLQIVAR